MRKLVPTPTAIALVAFVSTVSSIGTLLAQEEKRPSTVREKLFPSGEFFTFEGRPAFLLRPSPKKSQPQPWVFYAPTLSGYPDAHEQWMHQQFLDAGVAIAGVDVGEAFGSSSACQLFDRFYDELVHRHGMAAKPCLLGRSRGGLWVSSWASEHPERFAGIAGIYPVFDWRTYPGIEKASKAYGMTAQQLEADAESLNPISKAKSIAKAGLPVFIIHGDEDKVVPLEQNSQALKSLYEAAGNGKAIELKVVPGQGHNFWEGFFRCQELVDFVIKQAKNGS